MNALPFASETFDAVLAVDSIHHSNTPEIALSELIRIVGQGKRIIIFEPYVSLFSFFFYKLFHSENTSWDFRTKKSADLSILKHKKPGDGDQGVSKYLISIFSGNEFPHEVRVQYLSWISFFLTGGINSPLPISGKIISSVIRFESRFSQKIMKLIASRVLISIKKKS
jgi:SAM-dependent methyltransferase